jgi:hypothetical protein
MLKKDSEIAIGKFLYLGVPAVTLLVTGFANYDPVNVPKMFLMSGIAFATFFLLLHSGVRSQWKENRYLISLWLIFISSGVFSLFVSQAPWTQNFYGTFGRSTGFLTYISLSLLLLTAASVRKSTTYDKLVLGLLFSGIANVFLCALELAGINIFGFNNIYGNILGTFGNPNFISSFLGMFIAIYLSYVFKPDAPQIARLAALPLLALAFYEIVDSKSIQGLFVTGIGTALVGFFVVRQHLKKTYLQISYLLTVSIAGLAAVLGALQIGPLTKYIYKTSISLRGEYWAAGLDMGNGHLLGGVGFDTYGDWYRRARSASAMILPGATTVSNSAHNVNIELFASAGITLLTPYLLFNFYAGYLALRTVVKMKSYNGTYYALVTGWVCYQAQALISINQIGIAIWGWVLTGALIGHSKILRTREVVQSHSAKSQSNAKVQTASISIVSAIGMATGLALAFPAYYADVSWRTALKSSSAESVEASAKRWPLDSYRLANAALLFEQNKFPNQAYEMGKLGIKYNPYYFDAWKVMLNISLSTPEEKKYATSKMHELDPRNLKLE